MTVSRVVNGSGAVKEETKERVLKAIDELSYIPNQLAQGLARSSSKTVGVLFSNIFNPVYSSIISGIESRARELNYNIIISNAVDFETSVSGLDMLVSKMVDGLIILPVEPIGMNNSGASSKQALGEMWEFYEVLKDKLQKRHLPCVVIDIDIGTDLVDYVCHDYNKAAAMGMDHLIDCGFRKIHHINSELKEGLWQDRQTIYQEKMRANGLEEELRVSYCANSTQAAFTLVKELLESGERPEAFYCANDILAIGAMQAIHSLSLRIPGDISVMGNDGIYIGEMMIPSLTSVDINSEQLGRSAVEVCCEFMEGTRQKQKLLIEPQLLIRNSVWEDKKRKTQHEETVFVEQRAY